MKRNQKKTAEAFKGLHDNEKEELRQSSRITDALSGACEAVVEGTTYDVVLCIRNRETDNFSIAVAPRGMVRTLDVVNTLHQGAQYAVNVALGVGNTGFTDDEMAGVKTDA